MQIGRDEIRPPVDDALDREIDVLQRHRRAAGKRKLRIDQPRIPAHPALHEQRAAILEVAVLERGARRRQALVARGIGRIEQHARRMPAAEPDLAATAPQAIAEMGTRLAGILLRLEAVAELAILGHDFAIQAGIEDASVRGKQAAAGQLEPLDRVIDPGEIEHLAAPADHVDIPADDGADHAILHPQRLVRNVPAVTRHRVRGPAVGAGVRPVALQHQPVQFEPGYRQRIRWVRRGITLHIDAPTAPDRVGRIVLLVGHDLPVGIGIDPAQPSKIENRKFGRAAAHGERGADHDRMPVLGAGVV